VLPVADSKVRVGIVGAGLIGGIHAAAVRSLPEAELVAACDAVPGKAASFVAEHAPDASAFDDLQAMLDRRLVEAVCVCTPHPQHAAVVAACAERGVHAIVEKPFTATLADADRAIAAARRHGTKLSVIFQRRWYPGSRRIREAIDQGRLGRPILGECIIEFWRGEDYYGLAPWRGRWDTEGGGVIINQAPHMIDLLQWYMGPVAEVFCYWDNLIHPYVEVEDLAVAVVRFVGGGLGLIKASNCTNPWLRYGVSITGSTGATVSVSYDNGYEMGHNFVWTIPGEEGSVERWLAEERASGMKEFADFHALQIREFLAAVREDRQPSVTGEEGRKTVEIIEAMYRSGQTGRPVRFPVPVESDVARGAVALTSRR
jgi:UDP-N-acetyl-2-amino-2-deoxyglucuronate dehydrogenase